MNPNRKSIVREKPKETVQRYDWINDPNHFKTADGHAAPNRCMKCGFKFVGWENSAFCYICYMSMTPDPDELMYVILERPVKPTEKSVEKKGRGKWVPRREVFRHMIRIPEDTDEQSYLKKLEQLERGQPDPLFRAEFKSAKDLAIN